MGQFRWGNSGGAIQVGQFRLGNSDGAIQVGQFRWGNSGGAIQVGQFRWGNSGGAVRCFRPLLRPTLLVYHTIRVASIFNGRNFISQTLFKII